MENEKIILQTENKVVQEVVEPPLVIVEEMIQKGNAIVTEAVTLEDVLAIVRQLKEDNKRLRLSLWARFADDTLIKAGDIE